MAQSKPQATHDYQAGQLTAALEFLKRMRNELRMLRKVRVFEDRVQVFDVNNDFCELSGLGYKDPDVVEVLLAVNTVFKPESIHAPTDDAYKEFKTGRRYPWAQDRVM